MKTPEVSKSTYGNPCEPALVILSPDSCYPALKRKSEWLVMELLILNCHTFCSACQMMDYIHQCEASNQIYRTQTTPQRTGY